MSSKSNPNKIVTFPALTNPKWAPVPQLEQQMPVLAGHGHPSNWQAKALSERTDYLKKMIERISIPELPENITGGLSVLCSNEVIALTADKDGVVQSYLNSGCNIRVFEGALQLQHASDNSENGTWAITAVGLGINPGSISTSGKDAVISNHSGMPNDSNTARITYTIQGRSLNGIPFTLLKYQTFSKVFSVIGQDGDDGKSAYELAVQNGYVGTLEQWLEAQKGRDGENGRIGTRSLSRSITGNTWSDPEAEQAYRDWGEPDPIIPVKGDTCTLYNISAKYSEMREYTDLGWQQVVSRIPGMAIMAQSITTEQLLVAGMGVSISADPNTQDITAWTGAGITLAPDPSAPNGATAIRMTGQNSIVLSRRFPIERLKNHRIRTWLRGEGASSATLIVNFLNADGIRLSGSVYPESWTITGTYHSYGLIADDVPNVYTQYQVDFGPNELRKIPADARYMQIGINANITAPGVQYMTGMYCQQKTDGSILVDGTVKARHITSNGLIVYNELGQIVLDASGNNVPAWVVALENQGDDTGLIWALPPDDSNRAALRSLQVDGETMSADYSPSGKSIFIDTTNTKIRDVIYTDILTLGYTDGYQTVWKGLYDMRPNTHYLVELYPRVGHTNNASSSSFQMGLGILVPPGSKGESSVSGAFDVSVETRISMGSITAPGLGVSTPYLNTPQCTLLIKSGPNGGPLKIQGQANTNNIQFRTGNRFIIHRINDASEPEPIVARVGTAVAPFSVYGGNSGLDANMTQELVTALDWQMSMSRTRYLRSSNYYNGNLLIDFIRDMNQDVWLCIGYQDADGATPHSRFKFRSAYKMLSGVPADEISRWDFFTSLDVLSYDGTVMRYRYYVEPGYTRALDRTISGLITSWIPDNSQEMVSVIAYLSDVRNATVQATIQPRYLGEPIGDPWVFRVYTNAF